MRILFYPLYTSGGDAQKSDHLGNCTTYIYAKNVMRVILAYDPEAYFYFPIPVDALQTNDLSEVVHPRIKLLPMDINTKQYIGMLEHPKEIANLFHDRLGRYMVDVVLTTVQTQACQMRPIFQGIQQFVEPYWVNVIMYGIAEDAQLPEVYRIQQAAGMMVSDLNVYQSQVSRKRVADSIGLILSSAVSRRILEAHSDVPITSVPMGMLEAVPKKDKPRDSMVVSYGYALHEIYKFKEVFDHFDSAYCAGRKIRVLATTSSGHFVSRSKFQTLWETRYKKYFELSYHLSQQEFWNRASEAHAFLFLATKAESSFSVIEQFMLDQVGVFQESSYAREVTYDGYPYICKGSLQVATTLRYVLEHYFDSDVQEVLAKQKKFLRDHFDIDVNTRRLWDEIKSKCLDKRKSICPSKEILDLCKLVGDGKARFTWDEFAEGVKCNSDTHINVNKTKRGACRSYWRFAMQYAGYMDDCQGEDPVFVKQEDTNDCSR